MIGDLAAHIASIIFSPRDQSSKRERIDSSRSSDYGLDEFYLHPGSVDSSVFKISLEIGISFVRERIIYTNFESIFILAVSIHLFSKFDSSGWNFIHTNVFTP